METVYDELAEIRRQIAEELAQAQYKQENRKAELMAEIRRELSKGEPVFMTTEMREFGLGDFVGVEAYRYSVNQRILNKMFEDDVDDDNFSDVL